MKEKIAEILAIACLTFGTFMLSLEATGAYLTQHTPEARNHITLGSLSVELRESTWNEEKAQKLLQQTTVAKNPSVTNTGGEDAWIFLQVTVPVRKIALVDETSKKKTSRNNTPLFSYTPGSQWELVEQTDDDAGQVRVYGFRQLLKSGESTQPLFEQVTLANYLEGELTETDSLEMPIKVMAVQDHVVKEGGSLKEIYHVYKGQEG